MLDLNDFFLYVQVVDRGGFTAAGRELRIPKSTLSHRIQQLENNLGVRLLNRTSRRFGMTDAGEEFYRHAVVMLGRPDCKQVVIGLVVGREGFPICHEVFAGNTQDVTTLEAMLDRLSARIGLPVGSTIVMDRGMASAENIALLERRKLHYLIASRQSERDRWLASFA